MTPPPRPSRARTRAAADRIAGYVAALADLARMSHIGAVEIRDALDGIGLDLAELSRAGADAGDVLELRKRLK